MKEKQKAVKNLFFLALTLLVVVIPAVHECQDLRDCKVLSPIPSIEPSIEIAHPPDMESYQTDRFTGLAWNISALTHFAAFNFVDEILLSPFPFPLSSKQILLLRR